MFGFQHDSSHCFFTTLNPKRVGPTFFTLADKMAKMGA